MHGKPIAVMAEHLLPYPTVLTFADVVHALECVHEGEMDTSRSAATARLRSLSENKKAFDREFSDADMDAFDMASPVTLLRAAERITPTANDEGSGFTAAASKRPGGDGPLPPGPPIVVAGARPPLDLPAMLSP